MRGGKRKSESLREEERYRKRDRGRPEYNEGGNLEGEGGRDCRRRRDRNGERDDDRGMRSGRGRVRVRRKGARVRLGARERGRVGEDE